MRSVFALILLSLSVSAHAETTLTPSITSANGELQTSLEWSSTQASCTASGLPAWTGAQPTSGKLDLPKLTASGTYTLTLTCSTPASSTAVVRWAAPTTNTDGTPLTDLAGFRIAYGRAADKLASVKDAGAGATSYSFSGLAAGDWYFAVRAVNSKGVESALSKIVSKRAGDSVSEVETVTLTVNPVPTTPTDVSVK